MIQTLKIDCPTCEEQQQFSLIRFYQELVSKKQRVRFEAKSFICPKCLEIIDTPESLNRNLKAVKEANEDSK